MVETFTMLGISVVMGIIAAIIIYFWLEHKKTEKQLRKQFGDDLFRTVVTSEGFNPETTPEEEPQPERRRPGRPKKTSVPAPSSRSTH